MTSRITDPTFTGGAAVRPDGTLLFAKPPGRSAAEWDMLARAMLGQALRVPLPELPEPYRICEP
ncbi:hypothetical protein AB0M68_03755 [Streptomyces sp. NPDC051453]|uniref:hypothetical protein n=1 Tax=Streptomyces sp. NPDC051453 TaxID=3154941 RepID=UPI00343C5357